MKTEEEKKEIARLRTKAWRLANKEKKSAYEKEYKKLNREKTRERNKIWYHNNKEKAVAYRESLKDGIYSVYLLPMENYVGQTECMYNRMHQHKNAGRDITDAKVLGSYKTRKEALAIEASYHAKGYNGWNYGI